MWKASWIAFGISRGSWIRIECLTTGIVMPVTSASWKPSVPISVGAHLTGEEDRRHRVHTASAIAVTRLVAPGPEVASATPTLPEALA